MVMEEEDGDGKRYWGWLMSWMEDMCEEECEVDC
jgi:hypothetical protein